ncbi:MAG: FG-GAP-like repeat-containing protein, partial [Flexibacteraceae bacterium]
MIKIYTRVLLLSFVAAILCLPFNSLGQNPATTTFAGSGTAGFTNGTGTAATFRAPSGIAIDASGNTYVSDKDNHVIRKITPAGVVTTFAGSGTAGFAEGTGTAAQFSSPMGLVLQANGNILVADMGNHRIRSITSAGVVTTYAGSGTAGPSSGTLTTARFNNPTAIAIRSNGDLLVADKGNHMIRLISGNSVVGLNNSTSAGLVNGAILSSRFSSPQGIAIDADGNVYVSEAGNHNIRKINNTLETVTTFAGTGAPGYLEATGPFVVFNNPNGLAVDWANGSVYVADQGNHKIRIITSAGVSSTWAGSGTGGYADGTGNSIQFNGPSALCFRGSNYVYVAEQSSNRIRIITNCGAINSTPTITASRATTFCSGTGSITLTASTSAGYLWSTGETTQSITVNASGNYSVRAIATPCTSASSATTTVTINPVPTVTSLGSSSAATNSNLIINGTGLSAIASVMVGEVPARFTINSSTQITAIIPRLANSGKVSVSNATGCRALSTNLTVTRQSYSLNFTHRTDNFNNISTNTDAAPTFTDLDKDGLLDLIVGKVSGFISHYEQVSANSTSFTPITPNFSSINTGGNSVPTFTDIDGDGLLDMIVGREDGYLSHYEQASTNSASFTLVTNSFLNFDAGFNSSPTFTDVDSDGLLDLVVGDYNGRLSHFEQETANGLNFRFITNYFCAVDPGSRKTNPCFTDLNNDGLLDLLYGNSAGNIEYFKQSSANSTSFQRESYNFNNVNSIGLNDRAKPAFTDLDGDGSIDMLIGDGDGGVFHYEQNPTPFISSVSASPVCVGSYLTIYGFGFIEVSSVTLNGVSVGSFAGNESSISFFIPTNATSGNLVVYATEGTSNSFPITIGTIPSAPTISGGTSIAFGGTTTLTSSVATGNIWSNGATTQSITVKTAGTYSVRVVNGGCTSNIASITTTKPLNNYLVTTFAGAAPSGYLDATGTAARFYNPNGICIDANGNFYITDLFNHSIRKITPAGVVTTVAGTVSADGYADGTGADVRLNNPAGVVADANGNLYVADQLNHCIRKITPSGIVSTYAGTNTAGYVDGSAANARFNGPTGVAINAAGEIFVAEYNGHKIRKISADGTTVTTIAGSGNAGSANGSGQVADFNGPYSLVLDGFGNIYVSELNNNRIRKITPEGLVTTFAGTGDLGYIDGAGNQARFNYITGIAIDEGGNLYVVEYSGHRVRKVTAQGLVSTIAGDGTAGFQNGSGTATKFYSPQGIAIDANGNLFIADRFNNAIRKMEACGGTPTISGSTSIPAGGNTTLTSSSATGNLWSNGAITQSITTSTPGTYTLQVVSGACTSDVAT